MEKEFVLYKEALKLKKLNYDGECLGAYNKKGILERATSDYWNNLSIKIINEGTTSNLKCLAPLYQQAFKWFRDTHGLYVSKQPEFYRDGINFNWQIKWYLPKEGWNDRYIHGGTMWYGDNNEYPTEEEMELGILQKLIEIVTNKESIDINL